MTPPRIDRQSLIASTAAAVVTPLLPSSPATGAPDEWEMHDRQAGPSEMSHLA